MKSLIVIFLSLALLNTRLFAEDGGINPNTARAYEAYLVTFQWPDALTSEQVTYKNILSTDNLIRLTGNEKSTDNNNAQSTPFGNIEARLGKNVKILANKKWTLIFRFPGDTIRKSFYSEQQKDGYPELTGKIAIKLGRYLESDINYQHYVFDRFTQPTPDQNSTSILLSQNQTQPALKAFEPAMVLKLHQSNKTASKKVNYLDHPTIATLIYFEPIELEDAIDKVASQSMDHETGQSLTYNELQSTNELTKR
ncbi:hypothetical protein CYL31_08375 [Marinomonas sp. A3A]|uniref:CsiV family protein n=1 Tax=Marinomonas TaxID=28253 RepID=UPI001BB453A4|nr:MULTISPECIES: CsiV family protein [Marinomonas]QUX91433.1 hypothetical protein CYL31_08375 [Marinomonas sp. A3A]